MTKLERYYESQKELAAIEGLYFTTIVTKTPTIAFDAPSGVATLEEE